MPATLRIRVEPVSIYQKLTARQSIPKPTALDVPLAAGTGIVFRHPSFPPQSKTVQLAPGENRDVIWSFFDLTGYLWVEVRPWARSIC
ncbi:MAG: hypothetical protein R3C26_10550 [Calditrichia bacterium]